MIIKVNRCPACGSTRTKDYCSSPDADYLLCEACNDVFTWAPECSRLLTPPNWRVLKHDRTVEYRKFTVIGNHRTYLGAWLRYCWYLFWCAPFELPGDYDLKRFTLKDARIDAGYGLREFSQRIGILPSIYCNIELGKDPASSVQQEVIATALGYSRLPYIPKYVPDKGPLIPLHIRKAGGEPATEEDYRKMYDYLNDPDQKSGN